MATLGTRAGGDDCQESNAAGLGFQDVSRSSLFGRGGDCSAWVSLDCAISTSDDSLGPHGDRLHICLIHTSHENRTSFGYIQPSSPRIQFPALSQLSSNCFFFRSFWLSAIQKKVTSQYRPLPSAFLATMDKRTVGCLGGGQLGRMMVYAAHRLGVRMCVLDPLGEHSPAGQVSELSVKGGWAKNNGWARPVLWRITMHKGMQYIYIHMIVYVYVYNVQRFKNSTLRYRDIST